MADLASTAASALKMTWETVRFGMALYDSYARVMPEAQDIVFQLKKLDAIVEAIDKTGYVPEACVESLKVKSESLMGYVHELQTSNDKARSLYGEIGHFMIRVASSQDTRALMKGTFIELKDLSDDLVKTTRDLHDLRQMTTVLANIGNPRAAAFWRKSFKDKDWLVPFTHFVGSYNEFQKQSGGQRRQLALTRHDQKCLLYALCSSEEPLILKEVDATVSVYRFNELVESYSFPFDLATIPAPPSPQTLSPAFSPAERLSISKQIMKLEEDFGKQDMEEGIRSTINYMRHHAIQIFFSPEFARERAKRPVPKRSGHPHPHPHLHPHRPRSPEAQVASISAPGISGWDLVRESIGKTLSGGFLEDDEEKAWSIIRKDTALQAFLLAKAAEKWAKEMKGLRGKEGSGRGGRSSSAEELVPVGAIDPITLNRQHRSWKFFYERYMALWRIGQLSQAMFEDIDFPGTSRIITFLCFVEPLNEANWRYVLGHEDADWPHGRPKVFTFLREQLLWKDKQLSDGKIRALWAPPPIPGGGWQSLAQVDEAVAARKLALRPAPQPPPKLALPTPPPKPNIPHAIFTEKIEDKLIGVGPEAPTRMDSLGAFGFISRLGSIAKALPCAFMCRGGMDKRADEREDEESVEEGGHG